MTPSIHVAIPSGRGGWSPDFAMAFLDVATRPIAEGLGLAEEPQLTWQYYRSSNVCQNRHSLVRSAQERGVSHILWLDDDMTFPPDTLERLLRHRLPIVGANCTTRTLPVIPLAVKNNQRIMSVGKSGIEKIDRVGKAVMLVEIGVYDRVPLPWFMFEWSADHSDTYDSEDMYFCRKAKAAGYEIAIDHELSVQIGHMGEMEYTHFLVDEAELAAINARAAS